MGLWHGVEYYEKEKIVGEEYYQQWSNVSFNFILSNSITNVINVIKIFYKMLKLVIDCYVNRIRKLKVYTVC